MSFRYRKPNSIKIPPADEDNIIKSFEQLHPNLVIGKYYRFKSSGFTEYVGMFYRTSIIGEYVFQNVDRYIDNVLSDDHSERHISSEKFKLIDVVYPKLVKDRTYRFRLVGRTSMYYGKFDTMGKNDYIFSSATRYNSIGKFVDEYEDLLIPFGEIDLLEYNDVTLQ